MEGTYHHILVALDGSPGAKCALRHAVGLAGLSRARLTVVSVAHAAPTLGESMAANAGVQVPSEAGWLEDELRHAVAALPADQPVTSYLRFGAPADEILAAADELQANLIVMGSRRHSPLTSVSHKVLRSSRVPVLVVQAEPVADLVRPDSEAAAA